MKQLRSVKSTIMNQTINKSDYVIPCQPPLISIDNAHNIFENAFKYFLSFKGVEYVKKDGYDILINWLSCNNRKGLFINGRPSVGKTFAASYVITNILKKYMNLIVRTYDLKTCDIDQVKRCKICVIDDVGDEDLRNDYGTKRAVFSEIVDNAEKKGNILIITSNLTGKEILNKYGLRVYERLCSITTHAPISGDSERVK